MNARDVAHAALEVAGGEAEAIAQVESSGLARFAGSEVHQPTLIENAVVTLRVVQDSRAGVATTNRVDADGLVELVRRATEAAESAPPDDRFPGLAPPAEPAEVEGYDEETASLELLAEAGDFRIDLLLWNTLVESRSLVHGVSFQPSWGQLMKRNLTHQQDTPLFSPSLEHYF